MRIALICAVLALCCAGSALAEDFVGSIKNMEGEAYLVRQGEVVEIHPGDHIYKSDTLRTGQGSMGALFRDDTAISLGPDTELSITDFLFNPHEDELSFLVNMIQGSAAFVTGQLGHIKPEAFKVTTPQSTIGIRGTRFVVEVD